eukprot:scaffold1228_cov246-Pinguiococcus_pyrenoidosus.AAC.2
MRLDEPQAAVSIVAAGRQERATGTEAHAVHAALVNTKRQHEDRARSLQSVVVKAPKPHFSVRACRGHHIAERVEVDGQHRVVAAILPSMPRDLRRENAHGTRSWRRRSADALPHQFELKSAGKRSSGVRELLVEIRRLTNQVDHDL